MMDKVEQEYKKQYEKYFKICDIFRIAVLT